MSEDHLVSFSLELNVEEAEKDLRRVQTIVSRTLSLLDRAGLTNTVAIQQKIALLNQLRLAYLAVQAARLAAGDPLAWGMAAISVGEVAVGMFDLAGCYG